MTGLETISRLRNMLPDVGIIALTLLEGNAYRQAAMAAGGDDLESQSTERSPIEALIAITVHKRV